MFMLKPWSRQSHRIIDASISVDGVVDAVSDLDAPAYRRGSSAHRHDTQFVDWPSPL
jgi:hypothetical protein